MSTRAIIGIQNKDGTITGGWQWNDGKGLLPLLRSHFNTEEKIKELITKGVWGTIVEPDDTELLNLFTEWTKRKNSTYRLIPVEKCHLLKENHHNTEAFARDTGITANTDGSMTFIDFETAKGQDINYLYLFYPDISKWKVYQ